MADAGTQTGADSGTGAPPPDSGGTGEPPAIPDDHWAASLEDEGLRGVAANFDSQDALLEAIGYEAPAQPDPGDWRATLTSEDAKKFAENSPDLNHLIGRALDMQGKLSQAIVPPGKDATDEQISAYRKQLGVPATEEDYKFEAPEGHEPTEADKAFQATMAKVFHGANITEAQAKALNVGFNEFTKAAEQAQIEADKQFAEQAEAELHKIWPSGEYDANKAHAERASAWAFGDQLEEVRHLETKDGRFIMDHPVMLRAMAAIGREMQEGGMVPPMTGIDAEQIDDQITELRQKADKAQAEGNWDLANKHYQAEQALIAKKQGNRNIVGAGRDV